MFIHARGVSPSFNMTLRKCHGLNQQVWFFCLWWITRQKHVSHQNASAPHTEGMGDRLKSYILRDKQGVFLLKQQTHHHCRSVCFGSGQHPLGSHVSILRLLTQFTAAQCRGWQHYTSHTAGHMIEHFWNGSRKPHKNSCLRWQNLVLPMHNCLSQK